MFSYLINYFFFVVLFLFFFVQQIFILIHHHWRRRRYRIRFVDGGSLLAFLFWALFSRHQLFNYTVWHCWFVILLCVCCCYYRLLLFIFFVMDIYLFIFCCCRSQNTRRVSLNVTFGDFVFAKNAYFFLSSMEEKNTIGHHHHQCFDLFSVSCFVKVNGVFWIFCFFLSNHSQFSFFPLRFSLKQQENTTQTNGERQRFYIHVRLAPQFATLWKVFLWIPPMYVEQ